MHRPPNWTTCTKNINRPKTRAFQWPSKRPPVFSRILSILKPCIVSLHPSSVNYYFLFHTFIIIIIIAFTYFIFATVVICKRLLCCFKTKRKKNEREKLSNHKIVIDRNLERIGKMRKCSHCEIAWIWKHRKMKYFVFFVPIYFYVFVHIVLGPRENVQIVKWKATEIRRTLK